MSDELKNVTLAANDMAREIERLRQGNRAARASDRVLQAQIDAQAAEIDRLRDELRQARAGSAAGRVQPLSGTSDGPLAPGHENEIRARVEKAQLFGGTISASDAGFLLLAIDILRANVVAARAQALEDVAVDLVSGRFGVVWDEKLCEEIVKQGAFALVAYAQLHIAEALKNKAKADAS